MEPARRDAWRESSARRAVGGGDTALSLPDVPGAVATMRLPAIWAACAFVLVPVGAAIYGGQPAEEGEYPFMVHLYIGEPHDGIVCGGTLLTPTLVLTAGHCLPSFVDDALGPNPFSGGERLEDYRALIGQADLLGEGGEIIAIAGGHRHPEYSLNPFPSGVVEASNDIAVLVLERPSSFATAAPAPARRCRSTPPRRRKGTG